MRRSFSFLTTASLLLGSALCAPRLLAQPIDPHAMAAAQALHEEAVKVLDAKDYASACPKLEEVVRLVPEGLGARLSLAECYDTFIAIDCPGGNDCADEDPLANHQGVFHALPIQNPPAGTLPFDFNCDGVEEVETPSFQSCNACPVGQGFQAAVACGTSAPLGKCVGIAICSFQALSPAMMKTQRCK